MQGTQLLRRAVQCNPDGVATICGERRRSWRDIGQRVPRMAAALRSLGVRDGLFDPSRVDRFALHDRNRRIHQEEKVDGSGDDGACDALYRDRTGDGTGSYCAGTYCTGRPANEACCKAEVGGPG